MVQCRLLEHNTMISKYDTDILSKIIPLSCETYLKNRGWRKTAKIGSIAVIFGKEKENGQLIEILIPTDVELLDYKNRIADLLSALQNVEDRRWQYIASDIISKA
jgi:hypothetical protein